MKFVYVIVSSENDYYVEESLVSMHSLKMYNPKAKITAVIDKETFDNLKEGRERIKTYIDEVIIPEIPDGLSGTQKSRYLKTSLRPLVKGDFLYIDNDTVIKGDLSGLDKIEFDIGAVFNMHRNDWSIENPHSMIKFYYTKAKKNITTELKITKYYNGGIIFSKDTDLSLKFFNKWHELWWSDSKNLNFHKDQPALWEANYQLGNILSNLDDIYNCQIVYPKYALQYLSEAKILHYFSSVPIARHMKIKQKMYLKTIREKGITQEIVKDIINFEKEFITGIKIIMDEDLRDYDKPVTIMGRRMSNTFPSLNKPLSKVYKIWHKISEICNN